jgi:pimeloyl-ACP methyl ester carboxylesterase
LAALRALSRSESFATVTRADDFRSAAKDETVRSAVECLAGWIADGAFDMVRRQGPDVLRAVKKPVSLYWGRDDAWSTIDSAFFLTRRLSDARLRVLPGCGHLVGLQTANLLGRSLARTLAGPEGAADPGRIPTGATP